MTSHLIEQSSVTNGEVSIIPKGCQQSHIHVVGETTGERSREQELLILSNSLELDKAIVGKLRKEDRILGS